MRLIDADALMKALGIEEHCDDCQYHHHEVYCNRSCDFVTACEAISDAPTIEPEQRSFSCGQENDAISRKAAVDALGKEGLITAMVIIDRMPSAQRSLSCGQENDLISRQAAIDALTDQGLVDNMDSVNDTMFHKTKRAAQRILAGLPSAQPEPWKGDAE